MRVRAGPDVMIRLGWGGGVVVVEAFFLCLMTPMPTLSALSPT